MSDHPREESSPPAQRCDVCGSAHLRELLKVRRVTWDGERWQNGPIVVACSPLCLFGAAMNPGEYGLVPTVPPEAE